MLEIPHLRNVWSRLQAHSGGAPAPQPCAEGEVPAVFWDKTVFHGLGLGLRETYAFLFARPTFEEFERWILTANGGSVDPHVVARINAALAGEPVAPIAVGEPALSAAELAFFDEHGYVVLRNAVTRAAARAAEDAIWDFLAMKRDDPSTWYGPSRAEGIWVPLLRHPALDANRASPRIASAFAQLWNRSDLWTTIDRCGFNPPIRPDRPFTAPGLHWDVNLTPPIPFDVSAILYLVDVSAGQGAFTCVPGFHRRIDGWLRGLPGGVDPRCEDLSGLEAVHVPAGAGDLVIWHQALPHCATPNDATRPRIVQYLTMAPCLPPSLAPWR